MIREDSNVYARFKNPGDLTEVPAKKQQNNVEIFKGERSPKHDIEKQINDSKDVSASIRKIYIFIGILYVMVLIVLVFTMTNFVLIIQSHSKAEAGDSSRDPVRTNYHIELRDKVNISPDDPLVRTYMNSHPCDVYVGESCYFFEISGSQSFDESKNLCSTNGGKPANIYDNNYYEVMLKYIRNNTHRNITTLWLGMTTNTETGEVHLQNMKKVDGAFIPWIYEYPSGNFDATTLCLQVDGIENTTRSGFINLNPNVEGRTQAILCEMPWDDAGVTDNDDITTGVPQLEGIPDYE